MQDKKKLSKRSKCGGKEKQTAEFVTAKETERKRRSNQECSQSTKPQALY